MKHRTLKEIRQGLTDRFNTAFDTLEDKGYIKKSARKGLSYGDICVILGDDTPLSIVGLQDIRSGTRFIDYGRAVRFAEVFGISQKWMLLGEGPIFLPNKTAGHHISDN